MGIKKQVVQKIVLLALMIATLPTLAADNEAYKCLGLDPGMNSWKIRNYCDREVTVAWCEARPGMMCTQFNSTWTIPSGFYYQTTVSLNHTIQWSGCFGAIKAVNGTSVSCYGVSDVNQRAEEAKRRADEARAKEQQKIDEKKRERERIAADQAARQRYADEQRRLTEERHQEAERERFDKVQEALIREGGGRCIGGRDGLAVCEKALARVREENDKKKYADFKARKEREAEERRQAEHAAQVRAWDEERQRRHSMGCAEAEAEMRQAPEKIRQLQAQGTFKGAHGAAMLKEWLAALQARCGAPQAPMPSPQYQAAPVQTQSYQPQSYQQPPAAPAAQQVDPCENLRRAYENDRKNITLAYQLRRCVKKNRQAVQVQ